MHRGSSPVLAACMVSCLDNAGSQHKVTVSDKAIRRRCPTFCPRLSIVGRAICILGLGVTGVHLTQRLRQLRGFKRASQPIPSLAAMGFIRIRRNSFSTLTHARQLRRDHPPVPPLAQRSNLPTDVTTSRQYNWGSAHLWCPLDYNRTVYPPTRMYGTVRRFYCKPDGQYTLPWCLIERMKISCVYACRHMAAGP